MKTFTLMVWLLLPDGQSRLIEQTPVDTEAACIDGVIEQLVQARAFALEHKFPPGYAFDVTCRAGDYLRDGEERG
jgi:hypothetical protein